MLTLPLFLERTATMYGAKTAIIDPEGNFTWRQFQERVVHASAVLASLGIGPGDRFAVIGRNSFRQAEILQAGYRCGAVPVPVNFRLSAQEIAFIVRDSGCRLLVVGEDFLHIFYQQEFSGFDLPVLSLSATASAIAHPCYDDLITRELPAPSSQAAEDQDALLLYTGGTTGRAKGVRLTHRNIVSNAMQIAAMTRYGEGHRYLHFAPMFHAADLVSNGFIASGCANRYLGAATPQSLLQTLQDENITATMLPPVMIIQILQHLRNSGETYDLSNLEFLVFGSAPMPVEWIRRTVETLRDTDVWHGYGLTETSPILTLTKLNPDWLAPQSPHAHRLASAGQPVNGTGVKAVDDSGGDLGAGEPGEILVRGPQIAAGYHNLPDETAAAFKDGWFHTGDVGFVDPDGYLYLLDRKKDMVITGGENVYCFEVETVLCRHPGIEEAAVFGVPDEVYGEALFAAIVLADGATLSDQDVIEHCRNHIGGYKIPRRIALIDQLPRNGVGKINKDALRQRFGSSQTGAEGMTKQ